MCSRLAFAVESDGSTTYRCSHGDQRHRRDRAQDGSNQNRLRSVRGALVHSSARVRRHRARGTRRHGAPRRRALAAYRVSPGRGGDARRGGQLPSWDGTLRIDRYHRSIGQHSSSRKIACGPSALASARGTRRWQVSPPLLGPGGHSYVRNARPRPTSLPYFSSGKRCRRPARSSRSF